MGKADLDQLLFHQIEPRLHEIKSDHGLVVGFDSKILLPGLNNCLPIAASECYQNIYSSGNNVFLDSPRSEVTTLNKALRKLLFLVSADGVYHSAVHTRRQRDLNLQSLQTLTIQLSKLLCLATVERMLPSMVVLKYKIRLICQLMEKPELGVDTKRSLACDCGTAQRVYISVHETA